VRIAPLFRRHSRSLLLVGSALLLACASKRELREWQPSDHQPPPAVTPEGQGEAAEEGDPNARAAAALWGMRCASCHGNGGSGDGAGRPPGAALPDLTQAAYQSSRSDAQIHAVIKNGRGLMPAFGDQLSDLGIDALVQHVRTLARGD
jgi:mono/diheme cytochrome c family protein